ncbi:MAG: MATE family efflux transporter [SAR116 cluster bacterium]|nr:MAG: MATE family efflux transporter [SAR116 cluster bacterium]
MNRNAQPETGQMSRLQKTSWRHIWSISWPIFLANITVPLVGAVDTAMMGRFPDPAYIGGVALGTLVFNFLYFGLGFLRMCTTGLVAQAHGRNDEVEIEDLLIRGLIIALTLGSLAILASPIIHLVTSQLLTASSSVEHQMQVYVEIRLFAAPAALGNMVLLGCLFGRQQMRLCMVQIMVVNICNLLLNILFVVGFEMKIDGIALASVAAQWAGFIFTLGLIGWQWRGMLRGVMARLLTRTPSWFDLPAFGQFFSLGLDLILRTMMLLACEAIFLNNAAVLGDMELAAAQLVIVMFGIIAFGLDGYAHAAEALVGDAIGRKDPVMLNLAIKRTNALAFASSLLMGLFILAGEMPIIGALTNQQSLIKLTAQQWHWVALMPCASFLAFQMDGIFVGATRGREMRNAMLVSTAVFVALVWIAAPYGLAGLLAAFTLWLGMRGLTLWLLLPRVIGLAI